MPSMGLFDRRPFFEKALQYGVQHGIIPAERLDGMRQEAPKGMVQIARYFGTEFLRPDLELAKTRIVNLMSLYLEDACEGDLDRAAQLASIVHYNQGEICSSPTRLLVQDSIRDDFLDRVIAHSRAYVPGNPLDPATLMGSMVDATHCSRAWRCSWARGPCFMVAKAPNTARRFQSRIASRSSIGCWSKPLSQNHSPLPFRGYGKSAMPRSSAQGTAGNSTGTSPDSHRHMLLEPRCSRSRIVRSAPAQAPRWP